jgi:hypothetical protein
LSTIRDDDDVEVYDDDDDEELESSSLSYVVDIVCVYFLNGFVSFSFCL